MHADRTQQRLLLLLAVLLIAAGAAGGAASIGAFGTDASHTTLNENPSGHFFGAQSLTGSGPSPRWPRQSLCCSHFAGCSHCCFPPTAPATCLPPEQLPRAGPPSRPGH